MYPEITKLEQFITKHRCSCVLQKAATKEFGDLLPATLTITDRSFALYLDDEYNDASLGDSVLLVLLALRSLGHIQESTDYLQWCDQLFLNPKEEKLLEYYKAATRFCEQLIILFDGDSIETFISDLDFQLNAGAAQFLRNRTRR